MTDRTRRTVAWTAGLCVAALASGALTGCGNKSAARPQPQAEGGANLPESAVRVDTVQPVREDLQRVSESSPAELMPFEKTDLYAKVSGFLDDLRADIGTRMKKGELLATLSVPELDKELAQKKALVARAEAQLKQAEEAVKAAEANIKAVEALYRRWKGEYERIQALAKNNGVLDRQTVEETRYQMEAADAARDESKAKRDKAKADVQVAAAQVDVAQADQGQVEALLQYTRITAPYDGVVTRRNLHTGALTNPRNSDQALIFTVIRIDKLRVMLDIPEKEARFLDVAHPDKHAVNVELDALPGTRFVWKITRFAPVLGSGKKVRAEVEIDNKDATLFPGMYGRATVVLEDRPGALTLPAACLANDAKGTFVWVVAEGKAKQQRVTVGLNDGKRAEISAGLSGMEQVVSSGKESLREGQAIVVQGTR